MTILEKIYYWLDQKLFYTSRDELEEMAWEYRERAEQAESRLEDMEYERETYRHYFKPRRIHITEEDERWGA